MKVFFLLLLTASLSVAQIPEYHLTMSNDNVTELTQRDPFSDEYLPASFDFNGRVWNHVKVHYKGHSTRFFPKKSFHFKFHENQLFENARHLNLNAMYLDQSAMHEKLCYDLFADMGALAPHAAYAKLSLNEKSPGLYVSVERVDEYFLANRGRAIGPLYEAGSFFALADMTIQDTSLLKQYYPKVIGDAENYNDLHDLLVAINTAPDSAFADVVNRVFDIQSIYRWLAGNILTMMGDSYTKNYFLYRDTTRAAQQWAVIPWDYDMSFGLSGDPEVEYPNSLLNKGFSYTFPVLSGPDNVLKDRIWKTPVLREHLQRYVDTLLQTVFTEEWMFHSIDSLEGLIRLAVQMDSLKQGSDEDFLEHAEALKYFVTARRQYLLKTFVHPAEGIFDEATLRISQLGEPYHFVGPDGRLLATMSFSDIEHLDSILVVSTPGALPPDSESLVTGHYVRRFLTITPFPENAKFVARLQWMYHDVASKDSEVPPDIHDERVLKCFLWKGKQGQELQSRVNPVANTVTIDVVTEKDCTSSTSFILGLP